MKLILSRKSRDFSRAASALASCILFENVQVMETVLPGKRKRWQYDFSVRSEPLSQEKFNKIKQDLALLKGVETFIACGDKFEPNDSIPGLTRHPRYPIWYSTQMIQIPEVRFNERSEPQDCKYCDKLHENKFIARTQMTIAMLVAGIDPEAVKTIDYNYSAVNMVVNSCIDPLDIHLEEARGYYQALLMRQKLSSENIASMIHPSGERPVVAYISNLKYEGLKNLEFDGELSVTDLSLSEIGLASDEESGLIPIDANF